MENEALDVHFLVGGTQTNTTVIAAALRPHQGVVAAASGHINVHETGAIEATGHKVLAVPSADGKLTALDVRRVWEAHWQDETREHMVQPGMVYLSQPTENGTLYSLAELEDLWETCQDCGLLLYIDGARLGYGLMSPACDMTLPDLARRCDAFYLGGTKQGLLFGEALVIAHPGLQRDFRYHIKRHGGMLAKGRLLGVQFGAMLEDGLYFDLARQAVRLALDLRRALEERGYEMLFDSPHQPSSTPSSPTSWWRIWRRTSPSPSGRRWTRTTPPCASAPAGPRSRGPSRPSSGRWTAGRSYNTPRRKPE